MKENFHFLEKYNRLSNVVQVKIVAKSSQTAAAPND